MFRYERPQKGRWRQFNQIGVENIGSDYFLNDVEVVMLAHRILQEINREFWEADPERFNKIEYTVRPIGVCNLNFW
jgi:histidyl-tRNA synthetase